MRCAEMSALMPEFDVDEVGEDFEFRYIADKMIGSSESVNGIWWGEWISSSSLDRSICSFFTENDSSFLRFRCSMSLIVKVGLPPSLHAMASDSFL
jgi:hypothetical protein